MEIWKKTGIAVFAIAALGVLGTAQARDQIRIVGSSTVYPFSSYVAEEYGATTDHSTPVVESTGSGGGLKLFCEGASTDTPDITNASRRIKVSEFKRCQDNGVKNITEAMVGYDGIVVAHSAANDPINLTREQIHLAVAAKVPQNGKLVDNPYKKWSDIDASLPNRDIVIYGPPTSSGTRDAFEELVMEAASEDMDGYGGEAYTAIRQDGVYVPSGENDNLIVQKLAQNRAAFGVFGYSFLEENADKLQGATVDGVEPEPENISSGDYPVSRSLFFYIKHDHVGKVPGVQEYADLFMSRKMISRVGYLTELGLISLPKDVQEKYRQQVANLVSLKLSDLQ